jgi:hypothetical protein
MFLLTGSHTKWRVPKDAKQKIQYQNVRLHATQLPSWYCIDSQTPQVSHTPWRIYTETKIINTKLLHHATRHRQSMRQRLTNTASITPDGERTRTQNKIIITILYGVTPHSFQVDAAKSRNHRTNHIPRGARTRTQNQENLFQTTSSRYLAQYLT